MKPITFDKANCDLKAGDIPNCMDMRVLRTPTHVVSCWELDEKDLEIINRDKVVWLGIMTKDFIPPVFVTSEYPLIDLNIGTKVLLAQGIFEVVELVERAIIEQNERAVVPENTEGEIIAFDEKNENAVIKANVHKDKAISVFEELTFMVPLTQIKGVIPSEK